eukprot:EG_transcript_49273
MSKNFLRCFAPIFLFVYVPNHLFSNLANFACFGLFLAILCYFVNSARGCRMLVLEKMRMQLLEQMRGCGYWMRRMQPSEVVDATTGSDAVDAATGADAGMRPLGQGSI